MARSLAIVLVLAVVATAAFLIWRPSVGPGLVPSRQTPPLEDSAGADPVARRESEVAQPKEDPPDRRTVEAAAPNGDRPEHKGKRIRVVDASTGAPIQDPTVWFLDRARIDGAEWNALRRNAADADPMDTLESRGTICGATGADGEIRIPEVDADSMALVGASDPLGMATPPRAGWVFVRSDTPEPVVLEIGHVDVLAVAVLDAEGRPAPDVPLRLAVMRNGYWTTAWRGATGADGTTRIAHVGQRVRAARRGAPSTAEEALVFVDAPLGHRPRAAVDLADVPEDPVVLQLPQVGTVVVEVDSPDPSRAAGARASLLEVDLPIDESTLARGMEEPEVVDQRATFPLVGLDLRLRAAVTVRGANEDRAAEANGPRAPGQEVVVRVPLVDDTPVLVARLVDADGEPLGSEEVTVMSESKAADTTTTSYLSLRTDVEGRVYFTPRDELGPDAERSLRFLSEPQGLAVGVDVPRPLKAGENDLGTLRMSALPLLLSGRVVDSAGAPIEGAEVQLVARIVVDPDNPDAFYEDHVQGGDAETGEDGAFEIHGVVDGKLVTAFVEADGYIRKSSGAVPKGTRGVTVALLSAGRIRGEVLLPALRTPIYLRVSAEHRASDVVQSVSTTGSAFELPSIEAGHFDVKVALFGRIEPVAEVRDVVVEGGRTTELDPIDLTETLRKLTFRVIDPNGAPIRDARALWLPSRSPTNARYEVGGVRTRDGFGEIVVPDEPVDLWVYADHHRSQRVVAVQDGQDVVLPPAPVLVLRVPADAIPTGPFELDVRARLKDTDFRREARYVLRGPNGTSSMAGMLPWGGRLKATVDASGLARFELPEPGAYAIEWTLRKTSTDGGGRTALGDAQEVVVRDAPGEQVVDAGITKEQIESAIRDGF